MKIYALVAIGCLDLALLVSPAAARPAAPERGPEAGVRLGLAIPAATGA